MQLSPMNKSAVAISVSPKAFQRFVVRFASRWTPSSCARLGSLTALATMAVLWHSSAFGQYTDIPVPKGYVQLEGDVITTESAARELLQQGPDAKAVYAPARLWPNRVVPYDFDSAVTAAQRAVFVAAMNAWQNSFPGATTITFRPRNNEPGYLHLVVGNPGFVGGSTDYVGYNGGVVTMTVHSNSIATFLIAHELGHALGLWHEQARNDAGNYVTLITVNVQSGKLSQFTAASPQSTFGAYDYDSLMHYGACFFSACTNTCNCTNFSCATLATTYTGWQCAIGQQNHLSAMDQRTIAFMYAPADWRFVYYTPTSSANGSFEQPFTSFSQAVAGSPANSTVWLGPGTWSAKGMTISTPMTLKAAVPDLQLQSNGSLGPSPAGYATLQ